MIIDMDDVKYLELCDELSEMTSYYGPCGILADLSLSEQRIKSAKVIDPVTSIAVLAIANPAGAIKLYKAGRITAHQIMLARLKLHKLSTGNM